MGTPFISLLEPTKLDGYDRGKPHDQQPASIPRVFMDAMEVRESVFVREQGVPLEFEHDGDDARSLHWVVYASVNQVVAQERRDAAGNVVQPRRSSTRTQPIGTVRLVPFPHPPHPERGGRYVDNLLQNEAELASSLTASQEARIGRLAVVKEFRGHRIAGQLWAAARAWLENNQDYFNPSVQELGLDALKAGVNDVPRWNGLVGVHAQEDVVPVWERWGFQVDEGMGRWWEEGIPHVGMFLRLKLKDKPITIS
ncbi:uncharacterized protein JN550_002964 [Neoarthrinium moseri]|uniref:uncharacterized protein n=1 Tax=Neoarthrinium moseri TaxID=1658444 RepID=UPI001FDE79ED|nr:uncharacterized protein JN550_002964 [Neoarthrinium moseri]KAI1873695.1 hypothetical protein JN550_002964 [Neoarthrinium moseri]